MKKNKILAVAASSIGLALLGGASSYATITTDSNGVVETISGYNTISVSNVEATDSFIACKIVDVKYDSTTNAVDYDFTDQFKSFQQGNQTYGGLTISDYISTYSGSAEGALTGNTNLDALAAAYAAWLRNGHTSGTGSQCSSMTTNAPTASTTISTAGSYIILPVSSTKVYSVMIASVGVKEQNNDYVLDNSTYADITAKKGNPGAIEKTANGTTFAVGEDITYVLEVTVPAYPSNAINTQFVIEDNACYNSAGSAQCTNRGDIVFDTNQAPVVKDGNNTTLTAGTDYTITFTDSRLVVTIPQTKGVASPITITYHGSLTDAALAGAAQTNGVELKYPTDIYDVSSSTASTFDQASVKTLGIKIKKTSSETGNPALAGAEFQLFTDSSATGTPITCYTDVSGTSTSSTTLVTGTVNAETGVTEDGVALCRGIKAGTYYLRETKAPVGYSLNNAITTIEVTEANATDGITGSTTYTTGYKLQSIVNTKGIFNLPFTGGRGVIIYAIAGIGIVGIASVYYARKKKQNA